MTAMGRESYERNIINMEFISRVLGISCPANRERTADEVESLVLSIIKYLKTLKERHYGHLSRMAVEFKASTDSFEDFYRTHFMKGDKYYIQRVCDSLNSELAHYKIGYKSGRMAHGDTKLSEKQYIRLYSELEALSKSIAEDWSAVYNIQDATL